ncbi:CoA transferase [Prauserella flavalba]|uniref:CoA transferase n=1 Tax=Prauserella flavalba TaxID=1477506 RepID=UPI00319E1A6A
MGTAQRLSGRNAGQPHAGARLPVLPHGRRPVDDAAQPVPEDQGRRPAAARYAGRQDRRRGGHRPVERARPRGRRHRGGRGAADAAHHRGAARRAPLPRSPRRAAAHRDHQDRRQRARTPGGRGRPAGRGARTRHGTRHRGRRRGQGTRAARRRRAQPVATQRTGARRHLRHRQCGRAVGDDRPVPRGGRRPDPGAARGRVLYANRRPGYLDGIGLSPEQAAAARPGIVHATVSLAGERGPWANRVGFDQTAGGLTGMLLLEGDGERPSLPPIMVVNDYVVSWLLTAGIVEALARRTTEGGSYRVHVSLTRAALWILGMGVFDRDYAHETAGHGEEHAYLDPETFTADTPLGHYQGVTEQVRMSATPGRYRTVLVPRGSSRPEWLSS